MFRVSERFACRVVGQHRSTQWHAGNVVDIEEAKLRPRCRKLASEHISWGRRMVNHQRVHPFDGSVFKDPSLASRSEPGLSPPMAGG